MSEQNPIVKDTAQGTLNQVINSLDYAIASLTPLADDKNDEQTVLTAGQASGLVHHLISIKTSTESGFSQHLVEVRTEAKAEVKNAAGS
jgi:hypothetical protein